MSVKLDMDEIRENYFRKKVDMLRVIIMECMRIFILFDCKGV